MFNMVARSLDEINIEIQASPIIFDIDGKRISKAKALTFAKERFEKSNYLNYDIGMKTLYLHNS